MKERRESKYGYVMVGILYTRTYCLLVVTLWFCLWGHSVFCFVSQFVFCFGVFVFLVGGFFGFFVFVFFGICVFDCFLF